MTGVFRIEVNGSWTLATRAREARGFWSRGCGWMLQARPPSGSALVFRNCSSLHTWFMRFHLDIMYLDAGFRVVAVRPAVRPFRGTLGPRGTCWAVEMPSSEGFAAIKSGDQVSFVPVQNR